MLDDVSACDEKRLEECKQLISEPSARNEHAVIKSQLQDQTNPGTAKASCIWHMCLQGSSQYF